MLQQLSGTRLNATAMQELSLAFNRVRGPIPDAWQLPGGLTVCDGSQSWGCMLALETGFEDSGKNGLVLDPITAAP